MWCASRTAAILYGSVLHARLPPGVFGSDPVATRGVQGGLCCIARHVDPPDSGRVYGVQYGGLIRNMACIPHCAPC